MSKITPQDKSSSWNKNKDFQLEYADIAKRQSFCLRKMSIN